MASIRILILSDGRPGHYHLSEGIAAAIARRRPVEIVRHDIRRRGWPGRLLAMLVNRNTSPARLLRVVYGLHESRLPKADLIVSAGAETLAASICIARLTGAPNIFYGSLRRFLPEDFALVLTSYAQASMQPRHVLALKPSELDPDTLPTRTRRPGPGRPPSLAGLLIGGDSGAIRYLDGDWKKLFGFLEASHAAHGTRWIVSNSRRTSPTVSEALHKWAPRPECPIHEFIDVRASGAGTLLKVFQQAEAIVCTGDSSSMVSEAIWARLPVLGVTPERHRFTPEEEAYRSFLIGSGWCRSTPIAALTPEVFLAALGEITPLKDNPLDRLAGLLAERLPQVFATREVPSS
jgi:mitochondrial fission protein ELM1